MREDPEFSIRVDGTVWLFTPKSPEAVAFAQTALGLESWQWLGGSFALEHRVAPQLAERLQVEGWSVAVSLTIPPLLPLSLT